jgi:hypothetical protein
MNERDRQELLAARSGDGVSAQEWLYECLNGEEFRAIAHTESGAFCVLNAERPGMPAEYLGSHVVLLGPSLAVR